MKRLALLGCGAVGSRLAELLVKDRARLRRATGEDVELARVLVRDRSRSGRPVDASLVTDRFEDVLEDQLIDLAIEALGGAEPAATMVERLLTRGVSVVTANKTMMAHHGARLQAAACRSGASIAFEASVCAAVPVLGALESLRGDRIRRVRGVINGTSGFILSRLGRGCPDAAAALREAQSLGLAEPDPAADLSGRDAAEKLCILARAIGFDLSPSDVERTGIEHIRASDAKQARTWGFAIAPLATIDERGARTSPTLVPRTHALANLIDAENALEVEGDLCGALTLRGQGAGPDPTASAVIGDVVRLLRSAGGGIRSGTPTLRRSAKRKIDARPRFVRLAFTDDPIPPHQVIDAFAAAGVGIERIEWRREETFMLTHHAARARIDQAVAVLGISDPAAAFIADGWGEGARDETHETTRQEQAAGSIPSALRGRAGEEVGRSASLDIAASHPPPDPLPQGRGKSSQTSVSHQAAPLEVPT